MLTHFFVLLKQKMYAMQGTKPEFLQTLPGETTIALPKLDLHLGSYTRHAVTNLDRGDPRGRQYFDMGLRLMLSFQHELAAKCFLASLQFCPDAALSHAMVAMCHSPNYNFKGDVYYGSSFHPDDVNQQDLLCVFPSQQVAERHGAAAVAKMEELKQLQQQNTGGCDKDTESTDIEPAPLELDNMTLNVNNEEGTTVETKSTTSTLKTATTPEVLSDAETLVLQAVRILTCSPGVDASLAERTTGRSFADAMRKAYEKYPNDPEIAYWFVESLMVLNAWQLYEYPSGKALTPDVEEIQTVLERGLQQHPHHPGLCHLYVHLSEMSAHPEQALEACKTLRQQEHAGHLIHMPTQYVCELRFCWVNVCCALYWSGVPMC